MGTKENIFNSPLAVMAWILGASLILTASVIAYSFYRVKALNNTVSVVGSAEKLITSDTVKWSSTLSLTTGTEELAKASEQLRKNAEVVQEFFSEKGVEASQVTIAPVQISENCNNSNNIIWGPDGQKCTEGNITGYTFSQQIMVESDKVQDVTALAKSASEHFLFEDIFMTTKSLEYYYSKLDDLKLEMLEQATKNAKDRAQRIAESTGSSVGYLQSASVGVFQITAPNSTDFEDYGRYDTSTLEKKIVSVVRAAFTLK
ncbi:SIMPL domain-containing protein [Candidatus Gracilibacteria bacterium]|nr:SIMPL domain-containing protein [Candidatus Gracilibacteria bacterium]